MESRVERITTDRGCVELATIIMNGQEFTNLGAEVWEDESGKLRGILYANDEKNAAKWPSNGSTILTSWDGKIKVPATIGSTWEGNFLDYHGRRQVNRSYYFTIKGRKCRGVNYNRDWSQIVRFKEI